MILILTRNDIRPEFQHLKGHELSLQHTHMTVAPTGLMSAEAFSDNVVFLNEDDTVDVLRSGRREKTFPSILHFIATLTHRDVRTIDVRNLIGDRRPFGDSGHQRW